MHQVMPLISVIVPVYNAEKFLCACVDSVMAQTYENFELLLIDDGSTDHSPSICDDYAEKDQRIRTLHKENGGVSSARNLGLDCANGEYICFLDSDDTVAPTFLADRYANAVSTGSDVSICDLFFLNENSAIPTMTEEEYPVFTFDKPEGVRNAIVCKYYAGSCCTVLLHRKLVEGLRFREDIHFAEDVLFIIEVLLRSDRVCFTRKPLYNYISHPQSFTHVNFRPEHMTLLDSCSQMQKTVEKYGYKKELTNAVKSRTISCVLALIRDVHTNDQARKKYSGMLQRKLFKCLNLRSLKGLAPVMRVSALLAAVHPRLYVLAVKSKAKLK